MTYAHIIEERDELRAKLARYHAQLSETEELMRGGEERGYRLALKHIKEFGDDLSPEKAAEVLESRWNSEGS